MAAQMPTLTTGAAYSIEPPWPSRRAHLRLVPGSSAPLAPDSRSRAAVKWPQLLWLREKQMRGGLIIVTVLSPKTKCANLPYAMCLTVPSTASALTSFFAREGPVRLPQHLQYIDRSSIALSASSAFYAALVLYCFFHGFRCG